MRAASPARLPAACARATHTARKRARGRAWTWLCAPRAVDVTYREEGKDGLPPRAEGHVGWLEGIGYGVNDTCDGPHSGSSVLREDCLILFIWSFWQSHGRAR